MLLTEINLGFYLKYVKKVLFHTIKKYSFINFTKQIIDQINYTFPFSVKKKFKNEISKYVYGLSFYESMVEFKINRKQCIENKIVKNSGKSSGFEDFRSKKKTQ